MARGSDKLFHKRKERKNASLRRMKSKRSPYDMVLIVCEGEKSEPNYFRAMIDDQQLNTANIIIAKNTAGSSPRNVVDLALQEYRKEKEYDRVFCVFDKDQHPKYSEALDVISRERNRARGCPIFAVPSVPCFEFWLLVHFTYTTKMFDTGHGSICENVVSDLKKYIPNYEKGKIETYQLIKDKLELAVSNSKKVVNYCKRSGTDTPSTEIHVLVEYLLQLKVT